MTSFKTAEESSHFWTRKGASPKDTTKIQLRAPKNGGLLSRFKGVAKITGLGRAQNRRKLRPLKGVILLHIYWRQLRTAEKPPDSSLLGLAIYQYSRKATPLNGL